MNLIYIQVSFFDDAIASMYVYGAYRHIYTTPIPTSFFLLFCLHTTQHIYIDAWIHPYFEKYYGKERRNSEICAVGFEPNHRHTEILQKLETAYTAQGWKVKFFTTTAVDTMDAEDVAFYSDGKLNEGEVGASLNWHPHGEQTNVTVIDLARYLTENIGPRRKKGLIDSATTTASTAGGGGGEDPVVVMKVDIEQAEHRVLPHLIINGAWCQIDLAYVETHVNWITYGEMNDQHYMDYTNAFLGEHPSTYCHPEYVRLDDETYADTDYELPSSS